MAAAEWNAALAGGAPIEGPCRLMPAPPEGAEGTKGTEGAEVAEGVMRSLSLVVEGGSGGAGGGGAGGGAAGGAAGGAVGGAALLLAAEPEDGDYCTLTLALEA